MVYQEEHYKKILVVFGILFIALSSIELINIFLLLNTQINLYGKKMLFQEFIFNSTYVPPSGTLIFIFLIFGETVNLSAICDDETAAGQIWYSMYNDSVYFNSTPVDYVDNEIYTFNITINETGDTDVNLSIYCDDASGNIAQSSWIGFTVKDSWYNTSFKKCKNITINNSGTTNAGKSLWTTILIN